MPEDSIKKNYRQSTEAKISMGKLIYENHYSPQTILIMRLMTSIMGWQEVKYIRPLWSALYNLWKEQGIKTNFPKDLNKDLKTKFIGAMNKINGWENKRTDGEGSTFPIYIVDDLDEIRDLIYHQMQIMGLGINIGKKLTEGQKIRNAMLNC